MTFFVRRLRIDDKCSFLLIFLSTFRRLTGDRKWHIQDLAKMLIELNQLLMVWHKNCCLKRVKKGGAKMGELAQMMKIRITTTHLIQYPSGKWGFVGAVPAILAYEDPTPEKLAAARFGARFGPKTKGFESEAEARKFAAQHGCKIV